ncbi:unnamed protein product [Meganyctiphanes norvegica]|uniref:Zinc finger protein n=1 Tax=Meganyctiphanes norvegica TaxID=48144 RepID=A0AAV2RMB3_MEGNR
MSIPMIKRVNTLGITYEKGEIKDPHFEEIIENQLGVLEEELLGIDLRGRTRFLFKVSSQKRYENICMHFTGRDIVLDNHHVIRVDDISSYSTRIQVSRVPLEISNDTLIKVFQKFGEVEKCQFYFRKYGKYSKLEHTGERTVWMKLTQQVPQSIFIKQIQNYISVQYENQPFTCHKCGNIGHNARDCDIDPHEIENVVDLNETIVENLDIHSEQSQSSSIFKCSECGYECLCENILIEHMDEHKGDNDFLCSECGFQTSTMLELDNHMQVHTEEKPSKCDECAQHPSNMLGVNEHKQLHTGEKPFKCNICDLVIDERTAHEEHLLIHTEEILFSCTECDYNCRNEDVLFNHCKKMHNLFSCKKCDYKGKSEKNLANHVKKHSVEQIKCTKCEYTCKSSANLENHMKVHTGGRK